MQARLIIACLKINVQLGIRGMNFKVLKKMLNYVKISSQILVLLVGCVSTALGIAIPLMYAYIIDKVLGAKDVNLLVRSIVLFVIIMILQVVVSYIQGYMVSCLSEGVGNRIRKDLYNKMVNLDIQSKNEFGSANILSLFNNDVFQVTSFLSTSLYSFVLQILTFITIVILMIVLSIKLTLVSFITVPLFILLIFIMGRRIRSGAQIRQQSFVDINIRLQEDINGTSVLQIAKAISFRKEKFMDLINYFRKTNIKLSALSSFTNQMATLLASISEIIVICAGGYMFIKDNITLGVVIAFLNYIGRVFSPIIEVMTINQRMQMAIPSLNRIVEFLEKKSKIVDNPNAIELNEKISSIELKGVSLRYNNSEVLQDINLCFESNCYSAVVGASGSGKTSICNIIARFINESGGKVLINNKDIREYTVASIRKKLYVVIQEPIIYRGTLEDNILLGEQHLKSKLQETIKMVCLEDFVSEKGLESQIGDNGFSLSGGEIRRISIARALIRDYNVLILDEPTNGIDNLNKRKIVQVLKQLSEQGKMIIVISHNKEDFIQADKIIVIKGGKVNSTGRHQYLIAENDYYNSIVSENKKA